MRLAKGFIYIFWKRRVGNSCSYPRMFRERDGSSCAFPCHYPGQGVREVMRVFVRVKDKDCFLQRGAVMRRSRGFRNVRHNQN